MQHYAIQAIISVSSCLAKRRLFCGFQKLKPVGFCVFCAFCGNYKQRSNKYKCLSPKKLEFVVEDYVSICQGFDKNR